MKGIIMKIALIMRARNLLMLIWKVFLFGDVARHMGKHLKTEL